MTALLAFLAVVVTVFAAAGTYAPREAAPWAALIALALVVLVIKWESDAVRRRRL